MLQVDTLRQEIEAALAAPETADQLLAAKRQLGLRFIVEVREGQSQADVAAVFAGLSDRFEVRPLFGPPLEASLNDRAFVAGAYGASFDDVSAHPWDMAHAANAAGSFFRVFPDVPSGFPEPTHEPGDAAGDPGAGWEHVVMRLPAAWKKITDERGPNSLGSNVVIAHPDTGWTNHPVWGPGQPNLDRTKGWNYLPWERGRVAEDKLTWGPFLQPGHGTHVGAVIAAPQGGKVVGAAPNSVLVPIRCITSVILIGQAEVVHALAWARLQTGCRVISMSWGGLDEHPLLRTQIGLAIADNIIVVGAAGQGNKWIPPFKTVFPAAYPECIAVAGIEGLGGTGDPRDRYKPWPHSCRGDPNGEFHRITISAPADPIYTAEANSENRADYQTSNGTSYATGFVAAAAALWLSYHFHGGYNRTDIKAQELFRRQVQSTAIKREGFDPWFYGLLNVEDLIATAPPPPKEQVQAEPQPDLSVAGMIAGLIGADHDGVRRLLAEALLGRTELPAEDAPDNVESWLLEISHILKTDQAVGQELSAEALTAAALVTALTPAASPALADRLAAMAAEPA